MLALVRPLAQEVVIPGDFGLIILVDITYIYLHVKLKHNSSYHTVSPAGLEVPPIRAQVG